MPARSIFRQVTFGGDSSPRRANGSPPPRDGERRPEARRPDLATRFDALLGILREPPERASLLELGCGPGLLLDHLRATGHETRFDYTGVDLSPPMIEAAARLWPEARFFRRDILDAPFSEQSFDYVIVNAVTVEAPAAGGADGCARAERLIEAAYRFCRIGVAFGLTIAPSTEGHREPFAWSYEVLFDFLSARVTRHVVLRGDLDLDDYIAYLYREPRR